MDLERDCISKDEKKRKANERQKATEEVIHGGRKIKKDERNLQCPYTLHVQFSLE